MPDLTHAEALAALDRLAALVVEDRHEVTQTLARGVVRCSCGQSAVGDPDWPTTHKQQATLWHVCQDDATQVRDGIDRLVASAEGVDEAALIAASRNLLPGLIATAREVLTEHAPDEYYCASDQGHAAHDWHYPCPVVRPWLRLLGQIGGDS